MTKNTKQSIRGRLPDGTANPVDLHVGAKLRESRLKRGLSQERLAEEMNKVPDDKKEVVAALLLGTCQGVQIAAQMQQRATA